MASAPAPVPARQAAAGSGGLVCVYYRVAVQHQARAEALVREFQRSLRPVWPAFVAELHVRCELNSPVPVSVARQPTTPVPALPDLADATLMETYRFTRPPTSPGPHPETAVHDFLSALAAAAAPLEGLLRSPRHVEWFLPCAL